MKNTEDKIILITVHARRLVKETQDLISRLELKTIKEEELEKAYKEIVCKKIEKLGELIKDE